MVPYWTEAGKRIHLVRRWWAGGICRDRPPRSRQARARL